MGKICSINALIQGIYGWGEGYYSNEAAEMYELFWTRYIPKRNTFKVGIHNGNFGKDIYLYGLYGGLNVHPMQITGILETSNSAESEMFQFQLRDLDSILKDLNAIKQTVRMDGQVNMQVLRTFLKEVKKDIGFFSQ